MVEQLPQSEAETGYANTHRDSKGVFISSEAMTTAIQMNMKTLFTFRNFSIHTQHFWAVL